MIIALAVSVTILLADGAFPALGLEATVRQTLTDIDFSDTLMKGLLSFLLFAGALHVDLDALLSRRWAISLLATVGIVTSTLVVAGLMFYGFGILGHCQRKVARTEFSTDDRELGRPELTPLGKRGGAVELEIVS